MQHNENGAPGTASRFLYLQGSSAHGGPLTVGQKYISREAVDSLPYTVRIMKYRNITEKHEHLTDTT